MKRNHPHVTEPITRQCVLRAEGAIDANRRTITVSFSSEEPVLRQSFFSEPWVEVLGHDAAEVDLTRLNNGAPVLYNHDRRDGKNRIGVVERAWLEGGRGKAELRISKRAEVTGLWEDVADGILRNVSVSYTVDELKLVKELSDGPDEYRVTRWTPLEISLVDIPADPTVGVGRADAGAHAQPGAVTGGINQPLTKEERMTKKALGTVVKL